MEYSLLARFSKLNSLLTKGMRTTSAVKEENETLVSLLIKFYAMALYIDICTDMHTVLKCLNQG